MRVRRAFLATLGAVGLSATGLSVWGAPPGSANLTQARQTVVPRLQLELAEGGLAVGERIFIRIFKESRELELWVRAGSAYELFKTYAICNYSGQLGPKLVEGDGQAPEGFYVVAPSQMNPNSNFHLSFNLGFPNRYDRAHGRTGSYLMIHGSCSSIGCYAMTNAGIEEIYMLAEAAFASGWNRFAVHIFPFRMTEENMARHAGSPWHDYWRNLKQGYDLFESARNPPRVGVKESKYVFGTK